MRDPFPEALATASHIAGMLMDPATAWPDGPPAGGRSWPQSLFGGAAGIALLHVERARRGHGSWSAACSWLSHVTAGEVTAAANASLFFGAPALAYVVQIAASAPSRYRRALSALDSATIAITRTLLARAHARIDRGELPEMREFDLIRGLAGIAIYHLRRHPDHPVTRDTLAYLIRLTNPLPGKPRLPPWWTSVAPNGEPSSDYPLGHGNLGVSHGIGAALAVMSIAMLHELLVPGMPDAIARICAWTDEWRHGGKDAPWWPGYITIDQARERHVDQSLQPRPSWCYGVSGTARAQQLAGMALRDQARKRAAEAAMLSTIRDPEQLSRLPEIGLCHGIAGLLQSAWRMASDADTDEIAGELPRLATSLVTRLHQVKVINPELLDGAAGAALALHSFGSRNLPTPCWDGFLALA